MSPKPGGKRTKTGEQRPYYTCQDVIRYKKASKCDIRNLPGKKFDTFIVNAIGELGRHPEIIKSTIKGTVTRQRKALKPLKSELAETKKHIKEIDRQLANCLSLAKKKGAGSFTSQLLKEADELSQDRQQAEVSVEKLKSEIELRERATTDETLIAEALCNFEELFQVLPFEERIELMGKLIRKITIRRIVPEKDELPKDHDAFETQIRTDWYRIEFDFFITSLFRSSSKFVEKSKDGSYFDAGGGVRGVVSRTNFELNCVVGLPGARWLGEAFAVEPFQLPAGYLDKIMGPDTDCQPKGATYQHPIHLAQGWTQELANTPGFTITQIAEREGFSRTHIRGILRLVRLPTGVQKALSSLTNPTEIAFYSERRLRGLVYLSAKEQRAGFAKLQQRWEAQSRG